MRHGVPEALARRLDCKLGPRIFEQSDYLLYARAKDGNPVRVNHRDPLISSAVRYQESESVAVATLNFGSQVGKSTFSIVVGGRPELDFEIEIFPTKLDYETDYEEMLAEVQGIMTGLALEYLRATYRAGGHAPAPDPSHLEWLTLLGQLTHLLERSLRQIAERPLWGLTREPVLVPVEKVRRSDVEVRAAVRKGRGAGHFLDLGEGLVVRERINERRARTTLDTNEHRWLALQLRRVRQRLAVIKAVEATRNVSERRARTLSELTGLEQRIDRLSRLEPISVASDRTPPPGFVSLQLLSAAGYQGAYKTILCLSLGLRLEGGPLNVSVKDLSVLYEYWCYLALLRVTSELTGEPIDASRLFAVQRDGLEVLLKRGHSQTLKFEAAEDRTISLTYNPIFPDPATTLVPQRPDLLLTFEDRGWPRVHFVMDAKYRIDASDEYQKRYRTPGPPEDAINVLHRYRDALVQLDRDSERPRRTVVVAAAVFPFRESASQEFAGTPLWRSLERLGIGAIPALPDSLGYVREWLKFLLKRSGWAMSDLVIRHAAVDRATILRAKASEIVLLQVIPETGGFLEQIIERRRLTIRLPLDDRTYRAASVGFCTSRDGVLAVTHIGRVSGLSAGQAADPPESQRRNLPSTTYEFAGITSLPVPIPDKQGFLASLQWTSALALDRATDAVELTLTGEPDWRLHDALRVARVPFALDPRGDLRPDGGVDYVPWFELDSRLRARSAGADGFLVLDPAQRYFTTAEDVAKLAAVSNPQTGKAGRTTPS
jgi:hypothetical protein